MSSLQTKHRSAIAALAGVLLVLTGFAAPADAATARSVTLKASPTAQYAGSAVTFSGNVSKSGTGKVVKIQRRSGSTWVAAGQTKTTTKTGHYSVSLKLPGTAAVYTYRARAPRTGSLAGASSPTIKVTALRHTTITIGASPSSIGTGASTTLSGHVAPYVAGSAVVLQKLTSGSWATVNVAAVNAAGSYSADVTPPSTSSYRAAIAQTGVNGAASSAAVVVTVNPASPPSITTTSLPQGDKGVAYNATLTKAGGAGTWSISAGALPAGITLTPSTGALSGTPSAGGTANFTVKFTETATNLTAAKALSIVVTPPPAITTTSLPDVTQGIPYSTTLTKTGNTGTWSITGLPTGLSINATTGEISGTTTDAAGLYGVYPVFTETGTGRSVLKPLGLTVLAGSVNPPGGPTITTTSLPQGDKGVPYSDTLTKTGGAGTWAVSSGALPAGLTLNASTGSLSGTPSAAGTTSFTVTFKETSSGLAASKALSLLVTPLPTITTDTLPSATRGVAYTTTLTHTGHPGTWALATSQTGNGLPDGLTFDGATGTISGTVTGPSGTYGIYPVFTETSTGRQAFKALALQVTGPDVAVTTTSLPDGTTGTAYSQQLTKTGDAGTWTLKSGGLPTGVTLSSGGLLSGTPTASGDFGFTVTFTETASGVSDNQPLLLHVSAVGAPVITTTSLPAGTVGAPYSATLTATGGGPNGHWFVSYGFLPAGITLNGATGALSGTPTTAGDSAFIVTYETDTTSNTKALSIHVAAP